MSLIIQNVLICDPVDKTCADLLQAHGIDVSCKINMTAKELCVEVKKYDALIVRSETKITGDIIREGIGQLKVIGRAGAGVDNIDVKVASQHGILVLNTPGANSIAACELTCMLIGVLARPIILADISMKKSLWERKKFMGSELYGKTLAILGLGRIGREVGIRFKAWGMQVIGYDPVVSEEESKSLGINKMSLDEIWPLADFITVHTPFIPATKNLISSETLQKCKTGVKIVNVARGGIINEEALLEALNSGKCGGAGLDVYIEEPPKSLTTQSLISHPKVVATPHLGASTLEAQIRVGEEVAEQLIALTKKSEKFKLYPGVINKDVLKLYNL